MFNAPISRRKFLAGIASTTTSGYLSPLLTATPLSQGSREKPYSMDLSRSKHATLRTVPLDAVTINGGFWGERVTASRQAAIPEIYAQEVENGRIFNFQRLKGADHSTISSDLPSLRAGADSEIYKWLEAVGWSLTSANPALQAQARQITQDVIGAQESTGYVDTYWIGDRVAKRMLPETQISGHEVYCMGHLIQAGIAMYRTSGDRTLLDTGLRFIDAYILAGFGPEADKKPLISGHPGPEMALVELYRETSDPKYLNLAEYLLHGDSRLPIRPDQAVYNFAGVPFTGRTVMEGHAVRATYACGGAADYAIETGDPAYMKALDVLWQDMAERQMYVTGAVGARIKGEAFGGDYELNDQGSYCESCANIGVVLWAQRMLALTGEARFADVMERALYNGVNSGMALDGLSFNYRNPLLYIPGIDPKVRRPFWHTNCCPPNLAHVFASLQGFFYSTSKDGVHVHLYNDSEFNWKLEGGTPLRITQNTSYPWKGVVDLTFGPGASTEFTLFLRIPHWSATSTATVNGAAVELTKPGEYLAICRTWSAGDKVRLTFDMNPRLIVAKQQVEATRRRVAVQRGPLIYCMEAIDQPSALSLDQFALKIDADTAKSLSVRSHPELLGGTVTISAPGVLYSGKNADPGDSLYSTMASEAQAPQPVTLQLIP
jgi:uncharacterized protein